MAEAGDVSVLLYGGGGVKSGDGQQWMSVRLKVVRCASRCGENGSTYVTYQQEIAVQVTNRYDAQPHFGNLAGGASK